MKKKLAIIGGGITAANFIDACNRIGYEAHYFSRADGKTSNSDSAIFHEINIFDKDGIVGICREQGINGVVATTELTVSITAYVADKLGLPGNNPKVAAVITDKKRNRDCTRNCHFLKSPRYMEVSNPDEVFKAGFDYPIIVKPTNLGGKRGLSVVHNYGELQNAFQYANSLCSSVLPLHVIVEQFLQGGIECSVESISIDGEHFIIQITEKISGGEPHCVELGHRQPASLSSNDWQRVEKAVSEGLTAIGLWSGACHTEVKIINNEVYLIEFNARPGGDCIAHPLTMLSTGFDYLAALAKVATGELTSIDNSTFENNCSGLNYVVQQTSYLKDIFDRCETEEWCVYKNYITDDLIELKMNNMEHTNYFIFKSTDHSIRKKFDKV